MQHFFNIMFSTAIKLRKLIFFIHMGTIFLQQLQIFVHTFIQPVQYARHTTWEYMYIILHLNTYIVDIFPLPEDCW